MAPHYAVGRHRRNRSRHLTCSSVTTRERILAALQGPRFSLADSMPSLPKRPGLYAIYGDRTAWRDLGLDRSSDDVALYIGKAEDSFVKRDLQSHFGDGRTGSSTVRRSFAALLRTRLSLSGMPRNPARPAHFSNFGLSPSDDAKLTRWMRQRLQIAVWPKDAECRLADMETDLLRCLNPPLNIAKVRHAHRSFVQAQRKVMADQAQSWRPPAAPLN